MEQIIKNIYSDILELSDLELQKKLWLNENNETGLISSYTELMCRLFDDNKIEDFFSKRGSRKGIFSKDYFRIQIIDKSFKQL